MITLNEKKFILANASVPEHSVELMTSISEGEPFLAGEYFFCQKAEEIILVGYPLQHAFDTDEFEIIIAQLKKKFRPKWISLIAPELSGRFKSVCEEKRSDHYYTRETQPLVIRSGLKRQIHTVRKKLSVERATRMGKEHDRLSSEFIERIKPSPRVNHLLSKMPAFVSQSKDAVVLNAWDKQHNLTAFYIVDLAASDFSTYVIGCHSKKNYVPGASDLLFFEMLQMSHEYDKRYVHLGLGVNPGIERFKKKWGGVRMQRYEMCVFFVPRPSIRNILQMRYKKGLRRLYVF